MPFCELWRAEHTGVSVFAVLEVSKMARRALLFVTFGLSLGVGEVVRLLCFGRGFGEEAIDRAGFGGRVLGDL